MKSNISPQDSSSLSGKENKNQIKLMDISISEKSQSVSIAHAVNNILKNQTSNQNGSLDNEMKRPDKVLPYTELKIENLGKIDRRESIISGFNFINMF